MRESEEANPFEVFSPEVRKSVEGLLYLGQISQDFEFCGHTFGLTTLKSNQEIAAAKSIEQFRGTIKEPEAWASAQVGLALTHIDGVEDFCDQAGPDLVMFAKARTKYVTESWYWPTIEFLFQSYQSLLQKQVEAIQAIQDLSTGSLLTS